MCIGTIACNTQSKENVKQTIDTHIIMKHIYVYKVKWYNHCVAPWSNSYSNINNNNKNKIEVKHKLSVLIFITLRFQSTANKVSITAIPFNSSSEGATEWNKQLIQKEICWVKIWNVLHLFLKQIQVQHCILCVIGRYIDKGIARIFLVRASICSFLLFPWNMLNSLKPFKIWHQIVSIVMISHREKPSLSEFVYINIKRFKWFENK